MADLGHFELMNVATGKSISLLELFQTLCQILELEVEPRFGPARAGDIRHSLAAIQKVRERLDYEPTVDFRSGLERTVEWYRGQLQP